jgi:hypothetical protein
MYDGRMGIAQDEAFLTVKIIDPHLSASIKWRFHVIALDHRSVP